MTARDLLKQQSGDRYAPRAEPLTPEVLAELRVTAEQATPGPWMWAGLRNREYHLCTQRWGRRWVMRFMRMGMQNAQPMFQKYEPSDFEGPDPFFWSGRMVSASEIAIQEVTYRKDIVGFDNPDARYIARVDPTTVLSLLDRIAELEAAVDGTTT